MTKEERTGRMQLFLGYCQYLDRQRARAKLILLLSLWLLLPPSRLPWRKLQISHLAQIGSKLTLLHLSSVNCPPDISFCSVLFLPNSTFDGMYSIDVRNFFARTHCPLEQFTKWTFFIHRLLVGCCLDTDYDRLNADGLQSWFVSNLSIAPRQMSIGTHRSACSQR